MTYFDKPSDLAPVTKARSVDINNLAALIAAAFGKLPNELDLKMGTVNYAVNTGPNGSAYSVLLASAITAYVDGLEVKMRPVKDNTGACTLNVNGLGNIAIKRADGTDPQAGDILGGTPIVLTYQATGNLFRLPNVVNSQILQAASSSTQAQASAAAAAQSAATALKTLAVESDNPPDNPIDGQEWTDASNGRRYTWDANSSCWAETYAAMSVDNPALVEALSSALQLAGYPDLRAYAGVRQSVYVTGYLSTAKPMGIAGMFIRDDSDTTSADNGGTIIVATNGKRWKRVTQTAINALWFGLDPLGVKDSTAAIQAAINAANADGSNTVILSGAPYITGQLTYSPSLSLVGIGSGGMFTNRFAEAPVRINCSRMNAYVFDMPDAGNGTGALSLTNLCFDGTTAGGINSTTWPGLVTSSSTNGQCSFWLRMKHVLVGNSDSPTPILSLQGAVFPELDNVYFSNWRYGMGIQSGGAGTLATTITLEKCYFNSLRQVAEIYGNTTDVHFNHCVIESCLAGVAALKANITFNGGYSENMGYDPSGTGLSTGLTPRSFGIADAPAIAGNVNAIFTCRYGQMIFNDYTLQNTTAGKKWFDGIGKGSAIGFGGEIRLNNIHFAAGSINTLFAADDGSKSGFDYFATCKRSAAVLTNADARMLTSGEVCIQWSDGNIRPVKVDAGLFITPRLVSGGFNSVPTIYPNGGSAVGDIVYQAPAAMVAGTSNAWICTTAGDNTTAKWDTYSFLPIAVSATLAASNGTMTIPVPLVEVGTVYVYELMGSAFGAATSWAARIKVAQFNSGAGFTVDESTAGGITVAYSYGNPITLTNTNAGYSMNIYARLVSVSRKSS